MDNNTRMRNILFRCLQYAFILIIAFVAITYNGEAQAYVQTQGLYNPGGITIGASTGPNGPFYVARNIDGHWQVNMTITLGQEIWIYGENTSRYADIWWYNANDINIPLTGSTGIHFDENFSGYNASSPLYKKTPTCAGYWVVGTRPVDNESGPTVFVLIRVEADTTAPTVGATTVTSGATLKSGSTYCINNGSGVVNVQIAGVSDPESGISGIDAYYKKDGAARTKTGIGTITNSGTTYNIPITLQGAGTYVTEMYVYNNAGILTTAGVVTIIADTTAPSVWWTCSQPGWSNSSCTLTWNGSDASGIARYEATHDLTNVWSIGTSGTWNYAVNNVPYWVRAIDNAGNYSGWIGPMYIRVDTTAPTVNSITGTQYTNQTSGTKTVRITASDGRWLGISKSLLYN